MACVVSKSLLVFYASVCQNSLTGWMWVNYTLIATPIHQRAGTNHSSSYAALDTCSVRFDSDFFKWILPFGAHFVNMVFALHLLIKFTHKSRTTIIHYLISIRKQSLYKSEYDIYRVVTIIRVCLSFVPVKIYNTAFLLSVHWSSYQYCLFLFHPRPGISFINSLSGNMVWR